MREKASVLESTLQESRRAYMQLDEVYKGIVDKAQSDKTQAIKQCERLYLAKL
jgi:hypothetical protein